MRKIGLYLLVLSLLVIAVPVVILGGIGPGIKLSGVINKIPFVTEKNVDKADGNKNVIKVFVVDSNKIIEMPFEDYIAGVLSAEMPVKFDFEALKAQAVAARTYAASKMLAYGGKGCVRHPGADICSDIHCQAWVSKEKRFKTWKSSEAIANWEKITRAVDETKNQVVVYKDSLATGIKYFSTSGGKTENSLEVFGYAAPYLVSVDSPYESNTPNFKSTKVVSKAEFVKRIKAVDPKNTVDIKKLGTQIRILSWTEGGRVKEIKIGNKVFSGVDIRWAMNLKSADFGVIVDSKNVRFNVKGYGHGVGISQWGANEMGKRGYKYEQIIKHYLTGTKIMVLNDIDMNKKVKK